MPLYDEDGNIIEENMTPDELKVFQTEKATRDAELADVKEKLSKLETKDMNFKKLRDMNKEEKENLSSQQIELMQRQEKLEEEQKSFLEKQVQSHKDEASAVLAGTDDDLRKKILFHYERIKDDAVSKDEVYKKMREAAILAKGENSGVNPLSALNYQGAPPTGSSKVESEASREIRQHFKISDEDKQKYSGEWKPTYKK